MIITKTRNKHGALVYKQAIQPESCNKEADEQKNAVAWVKENYPEYFTMFFAVTNDSSISVQHMQESVRMGLKSGPSDLFCAKASPLYPAGGFEMKRRMVSKSKTYPAQNDFALAMEADGKFGCICYGFEAFKAAFLDYIGA